MNLLSPVPHSLRQFQVILFVFLHVAKAETLSAQNVEGKLQKTLEM